MDNSAALAGAYSLISRYEERIGEYNRMISEFEQRRKKLEKASRETKDREGFFGDAIIRERKKADRVSQAASIRAAVGYSISMTDLLTGNFYSRAQASFGGIEDALKKAIRRIDDEIHYAKTQIEALRQEIRYQRSRISALSLG